MPEKRAIPVRDEHARRADHSQYPGRHRGRRLLGVDAYGFAHYRAGDWVEVVRHAAVVEDGDAGPDSGGYRRPGADAPSERTVRSEPRRDPAEGRDSGENRAPGEARGGRDRRVETDLLTVHEVPLHLVGVSLDEYLRSVGDFLGPVEALGYRPVEGADPDSWEWVSAYARRWVEAFGEREELPAGSGECEGPRDADGSGADA